ncbi:hypothetical protein [Mesorhizobium sp. J8]|uniref:hypothetical protein n=1 Tax=Mesorhizobium sp. J8 TaxID=2777475 RepID=UPI001916388C|nr:hypothetical protein [Mesorhizobium sp. J8]BCM17926.1 hypothetical protein MJ8_16920 [Mesorhizobium sp. J8]
MRVGWIEAHAANGRNSSPAAAFYIWLPCDLIVMRAAVGRARFYDCGLTTSERELKELVCETSGDFTS